MNKVIIIAEAGVNHNGSVDIAKKLIDVAAEAGADYVKFQMFTAEKLVSTKAKKASYQVKNTRGGNSDTQFKMLKKLELSQKDFSELKKYCAKRKVKFLATAFDFESLDYLFDMGIDFFKIPSGEITNLPYLRKVASYKLPVVLSTGMASLSDIEKAVGVLNEYGIKKQLITVLHCNTEYPTPPKDVNIKAMNLIGEAFRVKIGYSDHTEGITVPIVATALGATMIEKHFTLNKNMVGPDHKASLEPAELKSMVNSIRLIQQIMGDGVKKPSPSEVKNLNVARRSIHLALDLKKGSILREKDLEMLRPGDGISPMDISLVIGKRTAKTLKKGHKFNFTDIRN
jgi:N-acetylneuraminate synthase/N,N'-diacetyllegionaminate synthase